MRDKQGNRELKLRKEVEALKMENASLKDKIDYQDKLIEHILEESLAGYWDLNFKLNKCFYSNRFKEMLGYEDVDFNEDPEYWKKLVHPDDLNKSELAFGNYIQSKSKDIYSHVLRYIHKDGSIIWVNCKGRIFDWDKNGHPTNMVGCHIDVTPLQNALEKVDAQKLRLIAKNKELDQFANIVSHDIKEPVRTISSFIEIFRNDFYKEIKNEKAEMILEMIESSSKRITRLVDALLDFTKSDWKPELKSINMNDLVANVINDLQVLIDEEKAKIIVKDLPRISVYPTELSNLFQNLISNAIKFSKPNEIPEIEISSYKHDDKWIFCVKDNGIGIPENFHERIFIIFKRINKLKNVPGNGVGLAQCKRIIDLHGGEIWVESKENVGSSFKFTLRTT